MIRLTLFVPGTPPSLEAWNKALKAEDLRLDGDVLRGANLGTTVDVDWADNDGGFGQAFSFGNVPDETVQRIDAAPGAMILQWHADLRDGRQEIVGVIARLGKAGALGVRVEQSKMGWETSRWLELVGDDDPWSWHRAAVTFLRGDEAMQSCGMHAFSLPDVLVHIDEDPDALQELASVLNVYQLAENPLLLSGQTFAPDAETPRRVVERWPDTQYPQGHLCHNPYGVWRLGRAGGTAHPPSEPALVFMPALSVLLTAREETLGRALTQEEVDAERDKAPRVAMEYRDAQTLERSRGFADIDPELAWAQWQLLRKQSA